MTKLTMQAIITKLMAVAGQLRPNQEWQWKNIWDCVHILELELAARETEEVT